MTEREELEGGIAALEAQRAVLGDAVVDTALAALRVRLARLDVPGQQLKPVTILFADVVESTRLSRRLEPEDVQAVMDGALRRFTSIVESQHGRVFQYAGDGLLAVFGAVESREDDPERAVRAGLAILDETGRIAVEVQARHGSDVFNVRVGIHTGPVLLGGGVDAEGSVRGIAVNIAARMEQSAPTGGLRISHTTYRHVRGMFDVAEEPPILLKGLSHPLRSYVVLGARTTPFGAPSRGVDGVETPLIGRDEELDRLIAACEAVVEQKSLSLVTVVGDAGIGKTRLMSELQRWIEGRPEAVQLFHGRAQPSSASVPYGLLRALLGERFAILDDDTQVVAHAKLAGGVDALFGDRSEEQIALIGQLIGLDESASPHIAGIVGDGKQLRDRAFHALTQYFRLLARERNARIVVLLDDLHWADDGSLDFIDYLAQACRDLPMMVLCLARPVLDERRPQWGSSFSNHQRIDLGPLSKRSSHQLLESLLSRLGPVPATLYDIVTSDAEGNPYFIEELVAMLIDAGVIVTSGDRWRMAVDRLVDVPIPSTLAGVLQARLDGLPPAEKRALQLASVIGHVFWDEPLRDAGPETTEAIERLRRRDLIRAQEPSSFEGVREYTFKHHLLHQVTYDGVLRGDKRHQHRLTAEWLVARSGERSGQLYGVIADHYERAADSASAAAYWHRAADVAAGGHATDAALSYLEKALDLTSADEPALRYELIRKRIQLLNLTGRRREEESQISELERLAETLDDDAKRAGAVSLRARLFLASGDFRAAAAAAARAAALADKSGYTPVALHARSVWASAARYAGDHARTRVLAEELLRMAPAAGDQRRLIDALHLHGALAADKGKYSAARGHYGQALELARAIRDKVFESVQLANLGEVERALGNYTAAADLVGTGYRLSRDAGATMFTAHFLGELGEIAIARDDAAAGLALVAEGLPIAREISHRDLEAWMNVVQGDAQLALGRLTDAAESYHHALRIHRQLGRTKEQLFAFAGLAVATAGLANIEEASGYVARIEAAVGEGIEPNGAPGLLWACYKVLVTAKSPRAKDVLTRAHSLLTERAMLLDEADRGTFLSNVPWHRAIMEAWAEPT